MTTSELDINMTDRETAAVESLRRSMGNVACYFDPDDLLELVTGMVHEAYGVDDDEDDLALSPTEDD